MSGDAPNDRWATFLGQWAIPDDLVAAAPASPYFFDPTVFTASADDALTREVDTPSDAVARDALPESGSMLDVGAGAGAASLRLGAGRLIAVDLSSELLAAFADRAARLGVEYQTIEGRWPDVATTTPSADVVVCHHVAYNVADLAGFVVALSEHATRRVVMELTAVHPMSWMRRYWQALHGLVQPERPTADDAIAVLADAGIEVSEQRWRRPLQMIGETDADQLARVARRLCLPPSRHGELRDLLAESPPPRDREVVTVWWDRPTH